MNRTAELSNQPLASTRAILAFAESLQQSHTLGHEPDEVALRAREMAERQIREHAQQLSQSARSTLFDLLEEVGAELAAGIVAQVMAEFMNQTRVGR